MGSDMSLSKANKSVCGCIPYHLITDENSILKADSDAGGKEPRRRMLSVSLFTASVSSNTVDSIPQDSERKIEELRINQRYNQSVGYHFQNEAFCETRNDAAECCYYSTCDKETREWQNVGMLYFKEGSIAARDVNEKDEDEHKWKLNPTNLAHIV